MLFSTKTIKLISVVLEELIDRRRMTINGLLQIIGGMLLFTSISHFPVLKDTLDNMVVQVSSQGECVGPVLPQIELAFNSVSSTLEGPLPKAIVVVDSAQVIVQRLWANCLIRHVLALQAVSSRLSQLLGRDSVARREFKQGLVLLFQVSHVELSQADKATSIIMAVLLGECREIVDSIHQISQINRAKFSLVMDWQLNLVLVFHHRAEIVVKLMPHGRAHHTVAVVIEMLRDTFFQMTVIVQMFAVSLCILCTHASV